MPAGEKTAEWGGWTVIFGNLCAELLTRTLEWDNKFAGTERVLLRLVDCAKDQG